MNRQNVVQSQKKLAQPVTKGILQRKCACGQQTLGGGECESCRKKKQGLQRSAFAPHADGSVTRVCEGGNPAKKQLSAPQPSWDFSRVQLSSIANRQEGVPYAEDIPEIRQSSGVSLPNEIRARAGAVFNSDFNDVRIHTGMQAVQAAARLSARAFTAGPHLYFGQSWYRPDTVPGLELIGHELTHVLQQRQGLSELDLRGVGDRYEQEAEVAGRAFARGEPAKIASATGTRHGVQRSHDPGGDAETVGVADSPLGLPFLGEVNRPEELVRLLRDLQTEAGAQSLGLIPEDVALQPPAEPSAKARSKAQRSPSATPVQRSVVAECSVPGVPPNVIGIAAHMQIGSACMSGAPGCRSSFNIPGDGQADLVRRRIPFAPEIGEIKPASWLGRGLSAVAQAQLAGYLAAYALAFPGSPPIPMRSFTCPANLFVLNPTQMLTVWGPSSGIYYYRCATMRRPRVRVPVPLPIPVPVTVPVPAPSHVPSTGPSAGEVARGAAKVGAGIGIGYLIYRGIRFVPSLLPPLWPTIPLNAAIP